MSEEAAEYQVKTKNEMTSEVIWHPNGGCLVVALPESGTLIRERLLGFKPVGEWLDRIEACKPRRNNT